MAGYQRVLNYQSETERLLSAIKGNTNGVFFFIHNTNLGNMCQYTEKWWVIHVYQSSFGRLFIPDCFVTPELLESWWIYIYIYAVK